MKPKPSKKTVFILSLGSDCNFYTTSIVTVLKPKQYEEATFTTFIFDAQHRTICSRTGAKAIH